MAGSMLYKGSDLQFTVCSLDLHLKEGNQRMGVGKEPPGTWSRCQKSEAAQHCGNAVGATKEDWGKSPSLAESRGQW